MRVTTNMAVSTLVTNIDRSYQHMSQVQGQLSSGSRLNRLSDDPAAVERSLALRSELRNIEQYQGNIDDGSGWLQLTESSLSELESLFVEARGLAVQGASSTYNASQRDAIADQVDQYLEQAVSLSEARYRGRFVFSGTQTGSAPYRAVRDTNGVVQSLAAVGDSGGSIEREIADGALIQVNVPGRDVFEAPPTIEIALGTRAEGLASADAERLRSLFGDDGTMTLTELGATLDGPEPAPPLSPSLRQVLVDLRQEYQARDTSPFAALIALRQALRGNDPSAVRATLGQIDAVRESLSSTRGLVGARVNRLEATRSINERVAAEMTTALSGVEDIDLAAAIVNLQAEQDVYQAALSSGSAVVPKSLMDFI
jgi:flagellar hook-associated protein 3 FlgL